MRGQVSPQQPLWYAIDIESLIEPEHPLRAVKRRADQVLSAMDGEFRRAYSKLGRPSIPPEMLLKALLLQALYSVRSERRLVEEIRVNLLYRWFLDLSLDAPVWDATSFTTGAVPVWWTGERLRCKRRVFHALLRRARRDRSQQQRVENSLGASRRTHKGGPLELHR